MRRRLTMVAAGGLLTAALAFPSGAAAHGTHLKAKMSGDQIVGAAGAPDGTGRANLHVLKKKGKVCFEVQWSKIGNKQGLEIGVYTGAAGENGTQVITLVEEKTSSPVEGCLLDLPRKTLKDVTRQPHEYHVNVKNKKYPEDGAIRGQLKAVADRDAAAAANKVDLKARLKGANEPSGGDPNGTGDAELTVNKKRRKICYEIAYKKIKRPFAAHIHKGKKGVDGPIVVGLFDGPFDSGDGDCAKGLDRDLVRKIAKKPRNFYVNVHNDEYPGGAIRGQLKPSG